MFKMFLNTPLEDPDVDFQVENTFLQLFSDQLFLILNLPNIKSEKVGFIIYELYIHCRNMYQGVIQMN